MEKIIKDIIDADREARDCVEQIEIQRHQLMDVINEQKKDIAQQLSDESAKKKAEYRATLEEELSKHQGKSNQEYNDIVQSLDEQFQKQKDIWVNEIFEHCLKKG